MFTAPSYFSQYFENQLRNHRDGQLEPCHIDRDPETFRDICKHLQGTESAIARVVALSPVSSNSCKDTISIHETVYIM